jgi:hypothetical protein
MGRHRGLRTRASAHQPCRAQARKLQAIRPFHRIRPMSSPNTWSNCKESTKFARVGRHLFEQEPLFPQERANYVSSPSNRPCLAIRRLFARPRDWGAIDFAIFYAYCTTRLCPPECGHPKKRHPSTRRQKVGLTPNAKPDSRVDHRPHQRTPRCHVCAHRRKSPGRYPSARPSGTAGTTRRTDSPGRSTSPCDPRVSVE